MSGPGRSCTTEGCDVELREGPSGWVLVMAGRLDAGSTGNAWRAAERLLRGKAPRPLLVDLSGLTYLDGSGIALLVHLEKAQEREGQPFEVDGLSHDKARILELYESTVRREPPPPPPPSSGVEDLGRVGLDFLRDLAEMTRFIGELSAAFLDALRRPSRIRWKDVLRAVEACGANAVPIVALIVFLVGLILAYQGAIALGKFGAQVFVADLVALSLVREIGPLMTAIVLTGRSGSAFAAELGTMKVREEIDALKTMGLSPMRFLVVPRVLAAVTTTPLLVILANVCGLVGGGVVYLSLGFTTSAYVRQIESALELSDVLGGLFKAVCFGIVVAAVGCSRGLQTRSGASAVGLSTTRAVVTGITLLVLGDGIFSIVYFYLGI